MPTYKQRHYFAYHSANDTLILACSIGILAAQYTDSKGNIIDFVHFPDNEPSIFANDLEDKSSTTDAGKSFAIVTWEEPSVTDDSCVVSLSSSITSGSKFYIGTTNVTYTAIDPSGNKADFTFMVTVTGELSESSLKIMYRKMTFEHKV